MVSHIFPGSSKLSSFYTIKIGLFSSLIIFSEAIMIHKISTFFICIRFYPNFIIHMIKDCLFIYGYNISEIHHQKEIISENTSPNKKQQKPRGSLMHFTTQIYMYYQQVNDDKLPVYIINVNYQQRHLSFLHFFIFKNYSIVFTCNTITC